MEHHGNDSNKVQKQLFFSQDHKFVIFGAIWKSYISRVCIPNAQFLSFIQKVMAKVSFFFHRQTVIDWKIN